MDKKKVEKNLDKAIGALLRYEKLGDKSSFPRAFNLIKDAKMELSKPDWISVEDELPSYGENVFVKSKNGYSNVSYRRKIAREKISRDIMDDNGFILHFNLRGEEITHWRKIEKLEA